MSWGRVSRGHQIFTDAEDVIKGLYEKGKSKKELNLKKGEKAQHK